MGDDDEEEEEQQIQESGESEGMLMGEQEVKEKYLLETERHQTVSIGAV